MVFKLVVRSFRHESTRLLSAIFGVAAAVGLLAWHIGVANTALSEGRLAVEKATAPFSAWITGAPEGRQGPQSAKAGSVPVRGRARALAQATAGSRRGSSPMKPLPPALIEAFRNSPLVTGLLPLATTRASLDVRPHGRVLQGPPVMGNFTVLPASGIPFENKLVEGRLPELGSDVPEVVASLTVFNGRRVPKEPLGTNLVVILPKGTATLKIVGYFEMSKIVKDFPTMYVNNAAWKAFETASPGLSGQPRLLLLETAKGANPADLGFVIDQVPEANDCPLFTRKAVESRFRGETVGHLVSSLPLSLTLAALTAICLLATVLMIGLALQRRRIAELRCAGMTRGGVASLVIAETFLILVAGWIIGVAFSALLLQIFLWCGGAPELPRVVSMGWEPVAYGALLALVVGGLAVILPSVRAMRVRPLEITGTDVTVSKPVSVKRTVLALLLLLPLPVLSKLPVDELIKGRLMLVIGMPCFVVAFLLAMHPLMRLTEWLFLRPLGWLLRLDHHILSRRLSRDPGRATGTILTLTLGLGGFMAIHIWGGTLTSSFIPSPEWPDVIVSVLPTGLSRAQADAVRDCPGVADKRVLPIETTQFAFDDKSAGEIRARGGNPAGVVLLFGADPEEAFGGESPLMKARFVEGDARSAARAMAAGDACVVPAMFSRLTKLHKGDCFSVAGRSLEIAGVVELNWHLVTSRAHVRNIFGNVKTGAGSKPASRRTLGMAFVSEKLARELSGNDDIVKFLWMNLSDELRAIHPLQAAIRLDAQVRSAVHADGSSAIQVHHRDEIADGTLSHGSNIVGTMAQIPFWSLVVTSTGIVALLVASVRGSRREFAVMRAIGMTRGQLARLILGEALLVTLCALLASFICGIVVGWSFTGVHRIMMSSGLPVSLIIPWKQISHGVAFCFALCLVMSILPLYRLTHSTDEQALRDE